MRVRCCAMFAVALMVLAGCGGSGGSDATSPAAPKPSQASVNRTVYEDAEGVCEGIGLREMARQLHVPADALSVAAAQAKRVRPVYQRAAIDGCLAGLKKHKP